jgi:hypothetical protein
MGLSGRSLRRSGAASQRRSPREAMTQSRFAPIEMGAGIAASPHCAERRICRCSQPGPLKPEGPAVPALDPGSPAQASPPTEPLPLARSQINLLDCAARRFAGLSTVPARRLGPKSLEAKTVQCSAALLGSTTLASRFAPPHRSASKPRRAGGRSTLPAPLPGWPRKEPESSSHCLPAEIGPLVTRRTRLPLPALGEAGTAVPIT